RRGEPAREHRDGRVPRPPSAGARMTPPGRHRETQALFERALRVVPGGIYGHQSPRMLVPAVYPYFFARGAGSRIWDVDGNEYIDLMCSYGPIVLGHNHPRVDEAARRQAEAGRCFNRRGPGGWERAGRRVALARGAGGAVFAKNGPAVCPGATRVARAATGRRAVLTAEGAYHGTHPWCSPLPAGVLVEDRAHIAHFRYNDLASVDAALDAHAGDVAAIMVSPFRPDAFHDQELPAPG